MLAGLLFNTLEKQLLPTVSLDAGRCLRPRLGSAPCSRCLNSCPNKALTLDGGNIAFHADRCTECMACISVCPNDALTAPFAVAPLLRVLYENRGGQPVVLSCGRTLSAASNRFIVPCIGYFAEPVLAAMNVVAGSVFYLDIRGCADCDNGHTLGLLQARMSGILRENNRKAELRLRYLTDAESGPISYRQGRRSFFGMVKDHLAGFAGPLAPSEGGSTNGMSLDKDATAIPLLLREALTMLPPEDDAARSLLHAYFHTLTASGDCNLCPRCTGMCPTGALKRVRNDKGEQQLSFTSAKCSGCGLCAAFCNKNALTLRRGAADRPTAIRIIA
jgi:ferredoxin